MNYELLKKEIELYKNCKENNQEVLDSRAERIAYYKFYDKDKLLKITEEDFVEYIGKLWASNMYGNKKYLVNKMINSCHVLYDKINKTKKYTGEKQNG